MNRKPSVQHRHVVWKALENTPIRGQRDIGVASVRGQGVVVRAVAIAGPLHVGVMVSVRPETAEIVRQHEREN